MVEWASQFPLFLPTLPSLSFYRQSTNPKTNHIPRALSYSSTKRTLGTTLPEDSRGSAIHIFQVKISIYVSPAEEGHWIGFIFNTTVVRCRWHHHYFVIVIVTKQHNKSYHVIHNSSSTRDRASPDNCFISLEKGDKATSEGSDRIKMELPLFFSLAFSSFNSCFFSPFNSIQNVYQQFSAHRFDSILMSFQTSASTLFGERRALNIFQCQWVGFHDSSYPWGDVHLKSVRI